MNKERLKDYSIISVGLLSAVIIFLLFFKYLVPVILPFGIAWVFAMSTRNFASRLSEKSRVPAGIIRLISSLFLVGAIFGALALVIWRVTALAWDFLSSFGAGNRLYDFLLTICSTDFSFFGISLPTEMLEAIKSAFGSMLATALSSIASGVSAIVSSVPSVLFFLLVLIISIIYVSLDLDRINRFITSLLPEKIQKTVAEIRDGSFLAFKKYLCSYILLSSITYIVVLVGFLLLRIKNAPIVALIIALLDVLPIIGVGTVLVPWGIFELATGNHLFSIGLLALFVINTIVRQLCEPKIVGKSLGLHPIATIIMLYAGYALFGIVGILLVPILSVIFRVILNKNHTTDIT